MNYTLFDTHAHYDHVRFQGQGPDIVKKLYTEKIINGVVIPAITYESNINRDMFPEKEYPYVHFAPGLHPNSSVNESWWDNQKKQEFERFLDDKRTVAVKSGLDFSKLKLTDAQKKHQIRFLEYFIGRANDRQLSLVLHIRDAADEMIKVLKSNPLRVEAVAHCYTYDYLMAEKLINVGITRFGIGGKLEKSDMDGLRDAVEHLPLKNLLLETDSPFLNPEGFEGLNTSENLIRTADLIAKIKQMPLSQVIPTLQRNAFEFYQLSGEMR